MISERQQVNKKHWDESECAYVIRVDESTRRFIWFSGTGRSGHWVVQLISNNGNQVGDAEYRANKSALIG